MTGNPKCDQVAQSFNTTGSGTDSITFKYIVGATTYTTGTGAIMHVHLFVTAITSGLQFGDTNFGAVGWQDFFSLSSPVSFTSYIATPTVISSAIGSGWSPTVQIQSLPSSDAVGYSNGAGFKIIINDNGRASRWGIFAQISVQNNGQTGGG